MPDAIERAEAVLQAFRNGEGLGISPGIFEQLVAELKAARAENEWLRREFATYAEFAEPEIERLRAAERAAK